jgi:hypothetical protein
LHPEGMRRCSLRSLIFLLGILYGIFLTFAFSSLDVEASFWKTLQSHNFTRHSPAAVKQGRMSVHISGGQGPEEPPSISTSLPALPTGRKQALRLTSQNSTAEISSLEPLPNRDPVVLKELQKNDTTRNPNHGFQAKNEMAPLCTMLRKQDVDFTLVIQISFSRLWIFEHQCRRWGDHPMSIAVWMENVTAVDSGHFSQRHLGADAHAGLVENNLEIMGCNLDMIVVSVMTSLSAHEGYPVNRLRNLALSKVITSHSITMDADFLVSADLYQNLVEHRAILATDNKIALVIPAFEFKPSNITCKPSDSAKCRNFHVKLVPLSKNDSMTAVIFQPFQVDKYAAGHSSTRSDSWFDQKSNTLVPIECVMSWGYEPYVVVRYCRDTPPFQEAFVDYGENKIQWIQHILHLGYKLFRVGGGFCVHVPHEYAPGFLRFMKDSSQSRNIANAFGKWLKKKIPKGFEAIQTCSRKAKGRRQKEKGKAQKGEG